MFVQEFIKFLLALFGDLKFVGESLLIGLYHLLLLTQRVFAVFDLIGL